MITLKEKRELQRASFKRGFILASIIWIVIIVLVVGEVVLLIA